MATVRGQAVAFAILNDVASLLTQRVSIVNRSDKKEARDKTGDVKAVAYYNLHSEVTVEGLGVASLTVSSSLSFSGVSNVNGTLYVDEVTIDTSNEDFVKTNIKATAYAGF